MKSVIAVGAFVLGLLSGVASAVEPAAAPAASEADRQFLASAHQFVLQDLAASHIATSKATSAHVQIFAKQIVEDYVKTHEEIGALAKNAGVSLPGGMDDAHTDKVKTLKKLSGSEFDRQYASDEITSHTMAVAAFEKAAAESGNAEIKAWADKRLKALRQNLQNARSMISKL